MKLTKSKLQQIIKEEYRELMKNPERLEYVLNALGKKYNSEMKDKQVYDLIKGDYAALK